MKRKPNHDSVCHQLSAAEQQCERTIALLPVDFRPDAVAAQARVSHGTTFRTEDAERHDNR